MNSTVPLTAFLLLIASAALPACVDPKERLAELIDEAAACEPGDTCVLAGDSGCTCAQPVNADRADEVDEAAKDVQCCNLVGQCVAVECASFENVRCEEGRCVGN